MILLASQHLGELKPFFELYPFVKKGDYFFHKNIAVYVNYGRDALTLGFGVLKAIEHLKVKVAILFGYSGLVDSGSLSPGEFCLYREVKLIHADEPVFNPIRLNGIEGFNEVIGLTVMGGYNLKNDYLRLFGDAVDRESYFFAKAVRAGGAFPYLVRVISDNNTISEIERIAGGGFSYDVNVLKKLIERVSAIEEDELSLEIFLHTSILDERKMGSLKGFFSKKRYTFSERQRVYRSIKIAKSWEERRFSPVKRVVFVEKYIDVGIKPERVIDDYTPYFHNLKDNTAVIFARKRGEFLRKTPDGYTPDSSYGYSLLSSYNCVYGCKYCFLRCYFKSFNPVIFVNHEDFFSSIQSVIEKEKKRPLYFYLGTFSDSVALSGFYPTYEPFVEFFGSLDEDVLLEIRTKSSLVDGFLSITPPPNVIVAFSLSPQSAIDIYEPQTPSLESRLKAMEKLKSCGYRVAARFDPVFVEFLDEYEGLIERLNPLIEDEPVEIGFLRYDRECFSSMLKKGLPAGGMVFDKGFYRVKVQERKRAIGFFKGRGVNFYLSME